MNRQAGDPTDPASDDSIAGSADGAPADPIRYRLADGAFRDALAGTSLAPWADALVAAVEARGTALRHGDLPRWRAALDALPPLDVTAVTLDAPAVAVDATPLSPLDRERLVDALAALRPWRKGPFRLADVSIDCEWRSDRKWDRLAPHVGPLDGRVVLDVGTGSGYHLWRMRGAGAAFALGIEPSLLYATQFEAIARHVADPAVQLLPLTLEALPAPMAAFDTAFSMGVLYHRRDAAAHLAELRAALRPGGELVLETLVSPSGDDDELPLAGGRYARMRNVHAMPSAARVARWIDAAGFAAARLVSVDVTTNDEQRRTTWMPHDSLAEALDPDEPSLTVEGHPRPRRALFVAARPA